MPGKSQEIKGQTIAAIFKKKDNSQIAEEKNRQREKGTERDMAAWPELLVKSDMCPHIASQYMWETSVLQIKHRQRQRQGETRKESSDSCCPAARASS